MKYSSVIFLALITADISWKCLGQDLTIEGGYDVFAVNADITISFDVGALWDTTFGPFPQWHFNNALVCTQVNANGGMCFGTYKDKVNLNVDVQGSNHILSLTYSQALEEVIVVQLERSTGAAYSSAKTLTIRKCPEFASTNATLTPSTSCTDFTYNCASQYACNPGYEGAGFTASCLINAVSSVNGSCTEVTCSGASCRNCCELNTLTPLSDVAPLSYNRSITAECCEGFIPKNNVSMDDFTCNTTGSIDVNLDCTPVVCSGANCSNCCALNSSTPLSDVEPLSYNQSLKVECCQGFISENSTEMSEFTCNTNGSIDVHLACKPVMCQISDQCDNCCLNDNEMPISALKALSYMQSVTVGCCTDFHESNGVDSQNFTCLKHEPFDITLSCIPVTTVATLTNETLKQGVIAGISICVIYGVFSIACIISIGVSWMRTIKLHSGIYVLSGSTLILFPISAGLSFGLNDNTPNFTSGGIGGLVIGVITILLVIGCCVWICISIINFVPEKTPNGNTPPADNIPRKNHVPAEEDTNMIPTYENL